MVFVYVRGYLQSILCDTFVTLVHTLPDKNLRARSGYADNEIMWYNICL